MLDIIATEAVTAALTQALADLDEDTVAALELKASEADLLAHTGDTNNPHATTAGQVGADPAGTAAEVAGDLSAHTGNTNNPHSVTKIQVGLGNVDNTSDASKPVSSATQSALDLKASTAAMGSLALVVGDLEDAVEDIDAGKFAVQSLTGAGAVNLTTMVTLVTATDEDQALTLGDGVNGQLKVVVLAAAGAGDSSVLTPATTVGWTDVTFDAAGQALTLAWTPAGWAITANQGATVT